MVVPLLLLCHQPERRTGDAVKMSIVPSLNHKLICAASCGAQTGQQRITAVRVSPFVPL